MGSSSFFNKVDKALLYLTSELNFIFKYWLNFFVEHIIIWWIKDELISKEIFLSKLLVWRQLLEIKSYQNCRAARCEVDLHYLCFVFLLFIE